MADQISNPLTNKLPSEPTNLPDEESEETMTSIRSRRGHITENEAKKSIVLMVGGILIILALVGFFGITVLQKLSDLTVSTKDATSGEKKADASFLIPPTFDPLSYSATKSADITLSGTVSDGQEVKLYINNSFTDRVKIHSDRTFEFKEVTLREGKNSLRVKTVKNNKESDFSEELVVSYFSKAPSLDVVSPADGRSFSKDENPILVSGKTDTTADIFINDRHAIMKPDGRFEYTYSLKDGDNDLHIVAVDDAGNQTEKTIKVRLQ